LFTTIEQDFKNLIENSIQIDLDLKNPYPNPRICMKVKTPKTAQLGQIVKLEYTFEYLEEGSAYFVI
jgi:hypothetical protein